jgi:hypothetical protein
VETHASLIAEEDSANDDGSNNGFNFIEIEDDQEDSARSDSTKRFNSDAYAAIDGRMNRLEHKLDDTAKKFDRVIKGVNSKFDQIITML